MTDATTTGGLEPVGIVGIIRLRGIEPSDQLLGALAAGGVRHVEVTTGTPSALQTVNRWRGLGLGVRIGVGTVLDLADARRATGAGAQFVVCPHLDVDIVDYCHQELIPVFPGAGTVTEVVRAWRAGASAVKLFPADSCGGPRFVEALAGPLPQVPLLPTGGVDEEATTEYARLGCAGVGVGSALVDEASVRAANWSTIRSRALGFVDAWRRGRESR